MKSITFKLLCRFLILAMLSLSFQTASAGIIATDTVAAASAVQADRAVVLAALSRADVANQLQAQGLDPAVAQARLATMTDQEVHTLATGITAAPAGADIGLGAIVVIGLLVWFLFYRK